jgi:acyl-CoA thioesterase FadM
MNLWIRLILVLVRAACRSRLEIVSGVSRVRFRVWPTDLDVSLHMNNGRYLSLMDLGRVDLLVRSGLFRAVRERGWLPVLSGAQVHFRRELRPFQPFDLETRLLGWDGVWFTMEQRFLTRAADGRDVVAAMAVLRGGFFEAASRRRVPVDEVLSLAGITQATPNVPNHAQAVTDADTALRDASKG